MRLLVQIFVKKKNDASADWNKADGHVNFSGIAFSPVVLTIKKNDKQETGKRRTF